MTYRVVELSELPSRIEPEDSNRWCVQVFVAAVGAFDAWADYASIKDSDDLGMARRLARDEPAKYRIFGRMPEAAVCSRCDGYLGEENEEGEFHPCYHCGQTGCCECPQCLSPYPCGRCGRQSSQDNAATTPALPADPSPA